MVGGNKKMTFEIISRYYSKENNRVDYYNNFEKYFKDIPINYFELLNDGVVDFLKWLTENNFRIALASSGSLEKIEDVLKQCEIKDYFELIVSGDMFKQSKPHPEIYQTVSKLLNIPVDECLVIEDSNYGIESSTRAGMFTIAKKEERFPFSQDKAQKIVNTFAEIRHFLEFESSSKK
ncbi:HAD family hydrolase [Bacillus sp. IB182487]|uniref:HAD family hydrolase n=2 Tax=Metabacillus arenae TaxID=2771434 RepID=A0A926NRM0_9BACI|nr:HAD family hydrolase [Metabacillus arenae]